MASKFSSSALKISARKYGAQAAAKAVPAEGIQVSKLPSGTVVASLENNSPLSRIGVFFKGGSRYNSFPGASSALAACASAGLSSIQRTGLNMVRTRESIGASLEVCADREVAFYGLSSNRDSVSENLSLLSSLTSNNSYRHYEFPNARELWRLDAILDISPQERVLDMAAKAAFRSQQLGNSVYLPDFQKNILNTEDLNDFVQKTHGTQGLVVVGTGVDHDVLSAGAEALGVSDGGVGSDGAATKYLGGDLRLETGGALAHVVVAGEGAKFGASESFACAVAAELLASGSGVKYGVNSSSVLLNAAKGASMANLKGINECYSDAGLLGFTLSASAADAPGLVSSMVSAVKSLSVSDKDIAGAKARAKASMLDFNGGEFCFIGSTLLQLGNVYELSDALKGIDGVSAAAVNKVLKKAFGGKLTVSAIGNIHHVPYSDTL